MKYNISIAQAYLETARGIHDGFIITGDEGNLRHQIAQDPTDPRATIAFALASISVIYSYLAVEAFVNYSLYCLWEDSRTCHDACNDLNRSNPAVQVTPRLADFYSRFGKVDDFNTLKNLDGIRDMRDRIKTVEANRGFRHLHTKNTTLWCRFLNLLEDSRHFLVHPTPSPERVQAVMRSIISDHPPAFYSDTATDIIRHFYAEGNTEPPPWLDGNRLFHIKTLEIPASRDK
jgi:hypothetical protein